ncbi:MAG: hypothetical protein ABIJ56_07065 [Pseudomonadota bacterium]
MKTLSVARVILAALCFGLLAGPCFAEDKEALIRGLQERIQAHQRMNDELKAETPDEYTPKLIEGNDKIIASMRRTIERLRLEMSQEPPALTEESIKARGEALNKKLMDLGTPYNLRPQPKAPDPNAANYAAEKARYEEEMKAYLDGKAEYEKKSAELAEETRQLQADKRKLKGGDAAVVAPDKAPAAEPAGEDKDANKDAARKEPAKDAQAAAEEKAAEKKEVQIEPKSCKACFDEEGTANDGCEGTSLRKLDCMTGNKRVREKCQQTCKLP